MDACKCVEPLRYGSTLNSRRAASPFLRLVVLAPRVFSSKLGWYRAKSNCHLYADVFPAKKEIFSKIEETELIEDDHLDDVEKDLKLMGINRCKGFVTDMVNWRRITESALACKRLLSL
ncbi:hypothetical protein TNCV_449511 [Trichonephila clavipes]|nr:hypothetical protein TNCV_449511 [Trichonephila clavipes]